MNRGVMCTYKHKTLGLSAYYGKRWGSRGRHPHGTYCNTTSRKRSFGSESCGRFYEEGGRRQLGVRRHDKKFLANKATLGAVMQIIQNRFVGLDDVFILM